MWNKINIFNRRPCHRCKGEGKYEGYPPIDGKVGPLTLIDPCEVCNGTGRGIIKFPTEFSIRLRTWFVNLDKSYGIDFTFLDCNGTKHGFDLVRLDIGECGYDGLEPSYTFKLAFAYNDILKSLFPRRCSKYDLTIQWLGFTFCFDFQIDYKWYKKRGDEKERYFKANNICIICEGLGERREEPCDLCNGTGIYKYET